jgi:hypothetical protein
MQRSAAQRFEVRRTVESAGSIARDWAIGPSMMIFTHKICSATWSHGRRWESIGPRLSAPGLGPPLPHLHRDWAHPCHICTGTGFTPATSECAGTATNPCGWSAHRMALPAWRSSAAGGAISSRTASAAAPAAATSAVGASSGKARRGGAYALGEQRIIRSEAVSAARWAYMPRLLGLHPIYTAASMVASYLYRGDYGCILFIPRRLWLHPIYTAASMVASCLYRLYRGHYGCIRFISRPLWLHPI